MYQIKNFLDNDDIRVAEEKGNIKIVEYLRDLSVNPATAITQYYAAQMNVRKRQALIELKVMNMLQVQELCNGCLEM